jgi:hypothetical protein
MCDCVAFRRKPFGHQQPIKKCQSVPAYRCNLVGTGLDRPAQSKHEAIEPSVVATELQQLSTRDAGDLLLRQKAPIRRELESLARYLNLPVQRDDTVERLRAKIVVENTIGSRLRSDAIQGKVL